MPAGYRYFLSYESLHFMDSWLQQKCLKCLAVSRKPTRYWMYPPRHWIWPFIVRSKLGNFKHQKTAFAACCIVCVVVGIVATKSSPNCYVFVKVFECEKLSYCRMLELWQLLQFFSFSFLLQTYMWTYTTAMVGGTTFLFQACNGDRIEIGIHGLNWYSGLVLT